MSSVVEGQLILSFYITLLTIVDIFIRTAQLVINIFLHFRKMTGKCFFHLFRIYVSHISVIPRPYSREIF